MARSGQFTLITTWSSWLSRDSSKPCLLTESSEMTFISDRSNVRSARISMFSARWRHMSPLCDADIFSKQIDLPYSTNTSRMKIAKKTTVARFQICRVALVIVLGQEWTAKHPSVTGNRRYQTLVSISINCSFLCADNSLSLSCFSRSSAKQFPEQKKEKSIDNSLSLSLSLFLPISFLSGREICLPNRLSRH